MPHNWASAECVRYLAPHACAGGRVNLALAQRHYSDGIGADGAIHPAEFSDAFRKD